MSDNETLDPILMEEEEEDAGAPIIAPITPGDDLINLVDPEETSVPGQTDDEDAFNFNEEEEEDDDF